MCNTDKLWKPAVGEVCMVWFDDGRVCWHKALTLAEDPYDNTGTNYVFSLIGEHDRKLIWSTQYVKCDPKRKPTIDAAIKATQGKSHPIDIIETLYDAGLLHE